MIVEADLVFHVEAVPRKATKAREKSAHYSTDDDDQRL